MPTLVLEKKEIQYLVDILNKNGLPDFESILNKNLVIYLQSILTASDKPAWIPDPSSESISKLLTDDSNL